MADSAQERTEQATPRRIKEARQKGQVSRSPDLTGALCLMAMVALVYAIKGQFILDLQRYLAGYFSDVAHIHFYEKSPVSLLNNAATFSLKLLAPFFGVSLLVVIASSLVQVGFLFSPEVLKPKAAHLNPMPGLQRMFSTRSLVELVKSVLKFGIIGCITYSLIKANLGELLLVLNRPPAGIYQTIIGFILTVAWWGALAYLALSLFDYMYQRYDYRKSLKMSKQEVKEEFRQTEGDQQIKFRQREMRRSMSLNRIISEVPQSTVVVTNPTHLAVALLYRQGEMSAPRVVAKGAGRLAEQIRKIARENKVPVMENKELARFLYKNVDVDQEIPLEIYQAVAQILAMVYRLKAKEHYRAI
ncbi:Flagellar biosynthetic protein FlhB [Pelotomaculum sp. FP]|uniref:flagellar biosynthesis protein FlhB n=1 Tax=Pelotomaculum sp. FP TaxID=261474 RepID=UPI001066E7C1|nr:flagellar biosynthesis protein FlhB [Pelotomaculum sp. FP]TEB15937.1 Flagellar biosynthetic protein FlhB [Pelotomaculum sp. FP]